jgi:hypothetical protein
MLRIAHARDHACMTTKLSAIRRLVSSLVAEDRTGFKRIDASVDYDDGSWLKRQ